MFDPCLCGSGQAAGGCCFLDGRYQRRAAKITLIDPQRAGKLSSCYLATLGSCCDKRSREHLVSEAVLKVLEKEQLVVRGLPWQAADEMKIGRNTLTARCLCVAHNTALSGLDSAAAQFFSAIEKADHGRQGPGSRVLVSGHDIERW